MGPEAFLEEATIMKKLKHKNLVRLYAVCSKEEPIYIVTELVVNGSLLSYLREGDGQRLRFDTLLYIAAQVNDLLIIVLICFGYWLIMFLKMNILTKQWKCVCVLVCVCVCVFV